MSSSGAAASAVAVTIAIDEEQKRERVAIDLHQSLHPLVEGTQKEGEVCTSISGLNSETLTRTKNGEPEQITFSRNLFADDTATANLLPDLKLETKISEPAFSNDSVLSQIMDTSGKVIEKRVSTISSNFFSNDTIDTRVTDGNDKLKGTIHSELSGFWGLDNIDTVVKNAAGQTLRELNSKYNDHVIAPDTICTRLK